MAKGTDYAMYDNAIAGAAKAFDVDPSVLKGIAYAESSFNPDIISGKVKSPKGATGLMQFMPDTAKRFGIDPTNPEQAIFGAAQYLRENLDKFGGDYAKAVAGYNWGENRKSFDRGDWHKALPKETSDYVTKVLKFAAEGAPISKAEAATTAPTVQPRTDAIPEGRGDVPEWGRKNPRLYGLAGAAREVLGPIVEAGAGILGGIGGAAAGAPAGPVGAAAGGVAGAGAGYATGKEVIRLADLALGNVAPTPVSEAPARIGKAALEGAEMEAGGRIAAPIVAGAIKTGAQVAGKVMDLPQYAAQKAARIARGSVGGGELDQVINALRTAPAGTTPSEALAAAGLNQPVAQALLQRAAAKDPKFFTDLARTQDAATMNALAQIAGGETQTAARGAQGAAKQELNALLVPRLEQQMQTVNVGGRAVQALEGEAAEKAAAATKAVEDVRRFTAAGERVPGAFEKVSTQRYPGEPKAPLRYTYGGELQKKADEVATKAAEGSLEFGEASRFAQSAADTLRGMGLKPLESAPVIRSIGGMATNPKFAGNTDVSRSLSRVADDIAKWTDEGGVIDAWALDSIRKNSVNAVIKELYPQADAKAQKVLAAKVMTDIKPLIVDAIEGAGGKGYRQYLTDYTIGSQKIAQTKLGAEAMDLYKNSPQKFVELVQGNSPEVVEKVFGPGKYDIAVEMSQDAMRKLQAAGKQLATREEAAKQATAGGEALVDLMKENIAKFKLPNMLTIFTTSANKALDILEKKVGKEVMKKLTEASKSAKGFDELLNTLPAVERNKVLRTIKDPSTWGGEGVQKAIKTPGVSAATINALRGPVETENALVQ